MSDRLVVAMVHRPANEKPLAETYCFVSVDDTGEGQLATIIPGIGATVMVTHHAEHLERMKGIARELGEASGVRVRLVRYTRAEIMWDWPAIS